MVALLIIAKGHTDRIDELVASILSQSILPDKVVFVVDRDQEYLARIRFVLSKTDLNAHIEYIEPSTVTGPIQIGYARDCGLRFCVGYDVIFTDADCVLSERVVEHHKRYLDTSYPVCTSGLRLSQAEDGSWVEDHRLDQMKFRERMFHPDEDRIVVGKVVGWMCITCGCNLGMNKQAIKIMQDVNNRHYGEARVFSPVFDGKWGFEDSSLSAILHYKGCKLVSLSSKTSQVSHKWHKSLAPDCMDERSSLANQFVDECFECDMVLDTYRRTPVVAHNLPKWFCEQFSELNEAELAHMACLAYPKIRVNMLTEYAKERPNINHGFLRSRQTVIPI